MPPLRTIDKLQGAVARTLLGLPPAVIARLAGRPVQRDGHTLDAQFQLALRLNRLLGREGIPEVLAVARRELESSAAALAPKAAPLERVEELVLAGVPARRYVPRNLRRPAPALVFFHGGGWTLGSLDSHDAPCRVIAAEAGAIVVSVDYRLAPEHPYPAAIDDALAAFRAVAAARDGIDPTRIAVGGDSAGGNLAAVVCHLTRGDAVRPALQWLVYPGTDMTMTHPSIESCGVGFMLEKATMEFYIATYLGSGDRRDPRASPLFSTSFAGLPPAMVYTAGFDPLRDEGAAYARALEAAGVPVTYRCFGPMIHGFLNTGGVVRGARAALTQMVGDLVEGLGSVADGQRQVRSR